MARYNLKCTRPLYQWLDFAGVTDGTARQKIEAYFSNHIEFSLKLLAGSLLAGSPKVKKFVRSMVMRFMTELPNQCFYELGLALRWTNSGDADDRWWELSPLKTQLYLTLTRDRYAAMLFSFHPSGRIREVAVKFLGSVKSGEELRFLLFRQNDWVPKLSKLAQSKVQERLHSGYLDHFVREPDLLAAMTRWKRNDLSGVVSQLVRLLVEPENQHHLKSAIDDCEGKSGRHFFAQLLATGNPDAVRFGAASEDPIVCCKSLQFAAGCLSKEECLVVANSKLTSKQAIVRVAANELKADSESAESVGDVWLSCLFDPAHLVRRTAVFHLKKLGFDVAELCRARIKAVAADVPAVALLADEGEASDVGLFRKVLKSDPSPRLRIEAIRGIGRHGQIEQIAELKKYLCSPNSNTIRITRSQLFPVARELESEALWKLTPMCQNPLGKRAIVQLVAQSSFWEALPWFLDAIAGQDSTLSEAALNMIEFRTGCGRYLPPTRTQRENIQERLDRFRNQFRCDVAESLGFCLGGFGFAVIKKEA